MHPCQKTTFNYEEGGGRIIYKDSKGGGRDAVDHPCDKGLFKDQMYQKQSDI